MRKRDLHILTSSVYTYTGDARFSVTHPETTDEWRLKIAYVQPRDAGIYECQINTEPKLNLAFVLRVEGTCPRASSPTAATSAVVSRTPKRGEERALYPRDLFLLTHTHIYIYASSSLSLSRVYLLSHSLTLFVEHLTRGGFVSLLRRYIYMYMYTVVYAICMRH